MSSLPLADVQAMPAFNPFPGLRPFEPEEDFLFFGRERQTDELLRKLRTTRFLSILGRSGSGKSSLVRSGLIPTLHGGGMTRAGSRWRVAIMRPGEDPLGNLADALCAPEALGSEEADASLTRAFFETTLRASQLGLVECVRQSRSSATDNVLILVDQLEELFRYRRSRRVVGRDEAMAFIKLLLTARAGDVPCYVAITMRSDFIGDCMEFPNLPEAINEGIYLVPGMTRDELRSAITGPVAVGGAAVAPRLVSRLLNDVGDDPDQLPILQHALMRTWERWEADGEAGEPLDLRHYEAIGTMREALSRHAEESLAELDERGRWIAEKLFRALTDKGSDARGVRRPAPLGEICALTAASAEEVAAVVETFRKPGRSFLMPPPGIPLQESSILDISHESLMRVWTRLAGWADEEARSAQIYLNVARAAQRHEEGVAALWRDPDLQLALTWREREQPTGEWARRYDPGFARAMKFLDDSRAERDHEVREKEARRRRELRQARVLAVILATASLVTMGLGGYAYLKRDEAVVAQHRAEAEEGRVKTALAEVRKEKGRTERQKVIAEEHAVVARQEQARAESQSRIAAEQTVIAESQRERADAERRNAEAKESDARSQKERAEAAQKEAEVQRLTAITEQEKAQASEKETKRLGIIAAARALALKIPQQKDPKEKERTARLALEVYRLNRDNGGNAQDPDIFEAMRSALDRLRRPSLPSRQSDAVRAVVAEVGGRSVLAGTDDGRLVRYDLESTRPAVPLGGLPSPARALAVSRDGNFLAAGGANGEIRIYDLRRTAPPRALSGGGRAVSSLAFDPAGARLAAANLDGSVTLWNVDDAKPAAVLRTPDGRRATAVAISPDGKKLAAGVAQGGALLWNVGEPAAPPGALCNGLDVRSLAFRPDGAVLACGGARGEILQASLRPDGGSHPPLLGHAASVNALAFDPTGEFLASAGSDRDVRLWNTGSGTRAIVLPGHDSWVWSVAFSPNGERVISAGEDRTIRVWPARSEVLFDDLCRAMTGAPGALTEEEWREYLPNVPSRKGAPCAR